MVVFSLIPPLLVQLVKRFLVVIHSLRIFYSYGLPSDDLYDYIK